MRSFVYAITFFLSAFMAAQFAVAAAVPVSGVSDAVFEAGTAIGLVGGAVLLVFALLGAFAAVRSVMGVGSASPLHAPGGGSYLADLEARLAAEDAANGVEWRDVGTGKSNLDYEREALALSYREATVEEDASWARVNEAADRLRVEAEASGADMALYDKFMADDATHDEAVRWSNKAANAEIKVPVLGPGWK